MAGSCITIILRVLLSAMAPKLVPPNVFVKIRPLAADGGHAEAEQKDQKLEALQTQE